MQNRQIKQHFGTKNLPSAWWRCSALQNDARGGMVEEEERANSQHKAKC